MGTIRVLIVDDSQYIRASLRSILQAHADVEVVADVGDGPAAVSTAEKKRPDVVLMDAQMPGMSGVEATRLVKSISPGSKVLFLAVHARHVGPAVAAGADAYLMKDAPRGDLLASVRSLGGHRREVAPRRDRLNRVYSDAAI